MSALPQYIERVVPLRSRPRGWYRLLVVTVVVSAPLPLLTALTLVTGRSPWSEAVYEIVLPTVLFGAPVLLGAVSATLGGGVLPSLALGVVPSLAWTATVAVGTTVQTLLGRPAPPADSPLWVIALVFLGIELAGALAGFLLGRVALLVWRRLS